METTAPLLAGLKVIDCGTFIFGPAAATVLPDFGADPERFDEPLYALSSDAFFGRNVLSRQIEEVVMALRPMSGEVVARFVGDLPVTAARS